MPPKIYSHFFKMNSAVASATFSSATVMNGTPAMGLVSKVACAAQTWEKLGVPVQLSILFRLELNGMVAAQCNF